MGKDIYFVSNQDWICIFDICKNAFFPNNLLFAGQSRQRRLSCSFSVPRFSFFIKECLCSCLLGPPAPQGAPLLECRCCHCHTCTTHRPSFLPLHSVSPGVQVLLFSFPLLKPVITTHLLPHQPHASLIPPPPPPFAFAVVEVPQRTTFLL